MLDTMLIKVGVRDRGEGTELKEEGRRMIEEKVSTILRALFNQDMNVWLGVLQASAGKATASDEMQFEDMMRRFRELQRTPVENLNVKHVQQLNIMIMDDPRIRNMLKLFVDHRFKR